MREKSPESFALRRLHAPSTPLSIAGYLVMSTVRVEGSAGQLIFEGGQKPLRWESSIAYPVCDFNRGIQRCLGTVIRQ